MHPRDDDIYASAPLRRLLTEQSRMLTPDLQRCFGTHGLLLGAFADDAPPALPLLGGWTTLRLANGRYRGDVQATADEPLPFLDDAFDLVLLHHALQAITDPSVLLDEVVRVLAPSGVLALTGVHPLSGWSPWFYWRARGRPGSALPMPLRLSLHLQQAGLEVERMQRVGSVWPGMRAAHPLASRVCGGGYVLVARKRRRMITPLRLKSIPTRVPVNSRLSPGARRSSAQ